MKKVTKVAVGGFAVIGANRLYESLFIRGVRKYVEKIESDVAYDDLQFCKDGRPLFLSNPDYDTTLLFVDGFRIRPSVGMNHEWLTSIHHNLKVNILAPVVGLQSMPFWLRNKEWSYLEELRQTIQIYDSYLSARGPGHRMVLSSFSYGSVAALTIAAKRNPSQVLLLSPIPAELALPEQQIDRLPGWIRGAARSVLRAGLRSEGLVYGRRWGWIQYLLPHYLRPGGASGGWDIADRECRQKFNSEIHNGQELRLRDLLEIYDAMRFIRTRLLGDLRGKKITLFSGLRDSIMTRETAALFAEQLAEAGCDIEHLIYEKSAHNLLLDSEADRVKQDFAERIQQVRSAALTDGFEVIDLTNTNLSLEVPAQSDVIR